MSASGLPATFLLISPNFRGLREGAASLEVGLKPVGGLCEATNSGARRAPLQTNYSVLKLILNTVSRNRFFMKRRGRRDAEDRRGCALICPCS